MEHSITDPTIIGLALMMLHQDGSFKSPSETTPTIAKLEYMMRLVFLLKMYLIVRRQHLLSFDEPCKKLQPWFTEKVDSTFNSLRSLQHRASSISYTAMNLPDIWWLDRKHYQEMLYLGDKISFSAIRNIFVDLQADIHHLFKNKILLGLPLHIRYDSLADDLSNEKVGYSFLSDPRNSAVFGDRNILIRAVLADPELRQQFIAYFDVEGKPIWNALAMRAWLHDFGTLTTHLCTICEAICGSPIRGTELTSMVFRNTKTRRRNLNILGQTVALMGMYTKTGALTGSDRLIPLGVDSFTGDMLVQHLALARPMAELFVTFLFPHRPDLHILYRYHLFVNNMEMLNTEALSLDLKSYTLPRVGVGLGVHAWRHIVIAFRRKLCSNNAQILDEANIERSVRANQAGHSEDTEDRIYGITSDTLAGAPEDLLPRFLDSSADWQSLLRVVPGGLMRPYPEVTTGHFDALAKEGVIQDLRDPTSRSTMSELVSERILLALNPVMERLNKKEDDGLFERVVAMEGMIHKLLQHIQNPKHGICYHCS